MGGGVLVPHRPSSVNMFIKDPYYEKFCLNAPEAVTRPTQETVLPLLQKCI